MGVLLETFFVTRSNNNLFLVRRLVKKNCLAVCTLVVNFVVLFKKMSIFV